MINGIAIENAGLILLQISITSCIFILPGTLTALHYPERTAAQYIFSTAFMIVILLALVLTDNPLNLLTRLSVGTAGMEQWIVLGVTCVIILGLGFVTHKYADVIGKTHHSG
jgi:ABC-2 type transport system permease protein